MRAILEAAARVFEEQGVAGATTDRIAERAGVSIGSLYQYFPSKDAILATLGRCHLLASWEALAPALAVLDDEASLDLALSRLVQAVVALNAEHARLHRLLFEEAPRDGELVRMLLAVREEACARIARSIETRGAASGSEPRLAARLVFDAAMALAHDFALDPAAGGDRAAREREIARLLAGYLGPGQPSTRRTAD